MTKHSLRILALRRAAVKAKTPEARKKIVALIREVERRKKISEWLAN